MGYQQATLKDGRIGCRLFLLGDNTGNRPAHQTIWPSRSVELLVRSTFSIGVAPAKNDQQIKVLAGIHGFQESPQRPYAAHPPLDGSRRVKRWSRLQRPQAASESWCGRLIRGSQVRALAGSPIDFRWIGDNAFEKNNPTSKIDNPARVAKLVDALS